LKSGVCLHGSAAAGVPMLISAILLRLYLRRRLLLRLIHAAHTRGHRLLVPKGNHTGLKVPLR